MAEPLVNHYGPEIPRAVAGQVSTVHPGFPSRVFLDEVLSGYEALALMERGRRIGRALGHHLPPDYPEALAIVLRAAEVEPEGVRPDNPLAAFLYTPYLVFVEEFGGEAFHLSMDALHRLTRHMSAEFSIRPFLERREAEVLEILHRWAGDPHPAVRRLVSEGTRPRLPWGRRLRRFQENPWLTLPLLERLRDDPDPVVRRSVANHLNDIGKDHPGVLVEVAERWMADAGPERIALLRHALRSLVKQGDPGALRLLGYGGEAAVLVEGVRITPAQVATGDSVTVAFDLRNPAAEPRPLLVDFRIHFVKARGGTSPKVFKLRAVELAPGGTVSFRKRVTLAELTTRKHYPGEHRVEALVNGTVLPLGSFVLRG
jgi:3-methyladenine DNA glycosylase AlkC